MTRKGSAITLSLQDHDKEALQQIALDLGITWGDKPNISKLIEAIARRKLLVSRNNDWPETRIRALYQSIQTLTDAGQTESAQVLAELLVERSEIPIPLKREIEGYLETPPVPWRQEIDQYIRRQQPFQLAYRDTADRPWNFTIRHARITLYERRQYLECWCDETAGNQDLPELQHNWSLRLDRIPEAAVTAINGKWQANLDVLEVEIHLLRGLAFAYESKTTDISNTWVSDCNPPVRRIVRRICSSFWFFREILRYGNDCAIISPEGVRDLFKQRLQALCKNYEIRLE